MAMFAVDGQCFVLFVDPPIVLKLLLSHLLVYLSITWESASLPLIKVLNWEKFRDKLTTWETHRIHLRYVKIHCSRKNAIYDVWVIVKRVFRNVTLERHMKYIMGWSGVFKAFHREA